jgi:hypothetical protein
MGWLKFSKREQRLLLLEFGIIKRFKEYTSANVANVVSRRSREKDPKQPIAFTATNELYLNQIIEWCPMREVTSTGLQTKRIVWNNCEAILEGDAKSPSKLDLKH